MGSDASDLGGIGEATLATWCHEVGISPNQANHDRKGFDYVLILPRTQSEMSAPTTLDRDPPEFTCFVQVKATRDSSKSIKIKLSNWQRFVAAPWPTFFLVVEVGADNKPVRAFLEHVDAALIEKALRRLAAVSPRDREQLHSMTMGLRPRESSLLSDNSGVSLLAAIRAALGDDSYSYLAAKKKIVDEVGYEAYPVSAEFSVSAADRDELYEKLADFAVGKSEELAVSGFTISETRFGRQRILKEVREAVEASVRVPELPPHSSLIMEARGVSDSLSIRLHCEVFHATTLFPFLPVAHRKIALRAQGVTFFMSPPKGMAPPTITLAFDLPRTSAANDVARAAPAAHLALALQREALTYELHTAGGIVALESATLTTMPLDFSRYAKAVLSTARIVDRCPIPLGTMIDVVGLAHQSEALRMVDAILAGPDAPVEATAGLAADAVPAVAAAAIVFATWLDLGEQALCVVAAISGTPIWDRDSNGARTMRVRAGARQMATRLLTPHAAERLDMRLIIDEVTQRLLNDDGIDFVVRVGVGDLAAVMRPSGRED